MSFFNRQPKRPAEGQTTETETRRPAMLGDGDNFYKPQDDIETPKVISDEQAKDIKEDIVVNVDQDGGYRKLDPALKFHISEKGFKMYEKPEKKRLVSHIKAEKKRGVRTSLTRISEAEEVSYQTLNNWMKGKSLSKVGSNISKAKKQEAPAPDPAPVQETKPDRSNEEVKVLFSALKALFDLDMMDEVRALINIIEKKL